jgi:hypothetical protein
MDEHELPTPGLTRAASGRFVRWRTLLSTLVAVVAWGYLGSYVRLPLEVDYWPLRRHTDYEGESDDLGQAEDPPGPRKGLAGCKGHASAAAASVSDDPSAALEEEAARRHRSSVPELVERELRTGNPEWSLLFRLFRVLAFANVQLRDSAYWGPAEMDALIDGTLWREREYGQAYFLLRHVDLSEYRVQPGTSAFVDGEIALMIAVRQVAHKRLRRGQRSWSDQQSIREARPDLTEELRRRLAMLQQRMEQSPVLCAESYPDECWTFCTVVVLSAMQLLDELDGNQAHTDLIQRWLRIAKRQLIDRETGMLISSFTQRGARGDGPEGSSIWFVAHALALLDPSFARAQYAAAKQALAGSVFGLGYAREWPRGQRALVDIDVGMLVPGLGAAAASTGFALLAAGTFDDIRYQRDLLASLDVFALPTIHDSDLFQGSVSYRAAGPMGNAVLLYALTQGGLWKP